MIFALQKSGPEACVLSKRGRSLSRYFVLYSRDATVHIQSFRASLRDKILLMTLSSHILREIPLEVGEDDVICWCLLGFSFLFKDVHMLMAHESWR